MKKTVDKKKLWRFIRLILLAVVLLMISGLLFGAVSILKLDAWHEFDAQKILNCDRSLIVYDKDGFEVSVLKMSENRIYVSIDTIPETVRNAFIAAEDVRFYKHSGFDVKRIIGAAIADLKSGSLDQGASTISQQLIKLSHLSSEKTFKRKIEEAILAYQMERQFEKDEILEMYLNYCYFGGGFYGIEAASRGYFGISASKISVSQAAMLAGILKSPSRYAPHINLEASTSRRNLILRLMTDYGFLDSTQYETALNEKAVITKTDFLDQRGYFIDSALQEACEHLGITLDELLSGGYYVYTSLDSDVQNKCEEIFADNSLFIDDEIQAAIAVVSPKTGMVSAMVGGRNTNVAMAYNRA
ncbi:MAG: penicillin-binding protein, partial [Clostridiales bacterium]|nr:penicillin-binding protein [Clostridiales bacterium]